MTEPEDAARDPARLAVLDGYGILDTPTEAGFDDVALLASRISAARRSPLSASSPVTGNGSRPASGFEPCQTPLSQSVCAQRRVRPVGI